MNRDTKHIDQLFSDKLSGLRSPVPSGAWQRMEQGLDAGKRKKAFLWFRVAAASVLLILAFGAGFYFAGLVDENTNLAQTNDQKTHSLNLPLQANTHTTKKSAEGNDIKPIASITSDQKEIVTELSKKSPINLKNKKAVEPALLPSGEDIPANGIESGLTQSGFNKADAPQMDFSNTPSRQRIQFNSILIRLPQQLIALTGSLTNIAERKKQPVFTGIADPSMMNYGDYGFKDPSASSSKNNKWTLGGQFAPIYSYRDISTTYSSGQPANSIADEARLNAAEEGLMAYAGGMNVDYRMKGKWSVQSGVYYSRIGQVNNDALEFSQNNKQFVLIAIHTSTGDINMKVNEIPPAIRSVQTPKDSTVSAGIGPVKVIQSFDFFEIPFLVKYRLLDKKLALNFTGGFSPAYMVKNSTFLEYQGEMFNAGDAANLNKMIVNSSLGMGLEFSFTQQIVINFQPTFKFALSPINSTAEFNYHPYSFSWFTGLSFRF